MASSEEDARWFDLIVLGTGHTQTMIAAAASKAGKRVLLVDSAPWYGTVGAVTHNLREFLLWKSHGYLEVCNQFPSTTTTTSTSSPYESSQSPLGPSEVVDDNGVEEETNPDLPSPIPSHSELAASAYDAEAIDGALLLQFNTHLTKTPPPMERASLTDLASKANLEIPEGLLEGSDWRNVWIDLLPVNLYARGQAVETLVRSQVNFYLEFRAVEASFATSGLDPVPSSRAGVFTSSTLSISEKRALGKFLRWLSELLKQDDDPSVLVDDATQAARALAESKADEPWMRFLAAEGLSPKLVDMLTYAIAGAVSKDAGSGMTVAQALTSIRSYLGAIGRYGPTPYLSSLYGSSEYAQAFTRVSALTGTVCMLRTPLTSILMREGTVAGIEFQGGARYFAPAVVLDADQAWSLPKDIAPSVVEASGRVGRLYALLDGSLVPDKGLLTGVIAPVSLEDDLDLMFRWQQGDYTLNVVPKNHFGVNITVYAPAGHSLATDDNTQALTEALDRVLDALVANHNPSVVWKTTWTLAASSRQPQWSTDLPQGLVVTPGEIGSLARTGTLDDLTSAAETAFHSIRDLRNTKGTNGQPVDPLDDSYISPPFFAEPPELPPGVRPGEAPPVFSGVTSAGSTTNSEAQPVDVESWMDAETAELDAALSKYL